MPGGAIIALAEEAGACVAVLNLPDGAAGTTTTGSCPRFFAGIREGWAEATARLLHQGRTLLALDTEIGDWSNRLVARTSQAQLVLSPRS
jgi:1,4-dihydroxy-2-naphthoyl-CoA hydrolase